MRIRPGVPASFALFFLILAATAAPVFGQAVLLHQVNGYDGDDWMGNQVAGGGDVNGDGKADFIVGAPDANPGGITAAGSAYIYSGANGTLLYQHNGTSTYFYLGNAVAIVGDVNGDGRADYIIGTPEEDPSGISNAGVARVWSGATGTLLYRRDGVAVDDKFGFTVAGAGDVNGDGRADFIIGAIQTPPSGLPPGAGYACVYSGATGALLYQKNGAAGSSFGHSVAGAGDVNGDGREDFIVGAINADPGGLTDAGSAFVYSGTTGAALYQKNGATADDLLGRSVAGAGDVNGDGRADFIIGAMRADSGGAAYVYSGATGTLLYQKSGPASSLFGLTVDGAGDANGDGRADFLVGAANADPGGLSNAGSAYLYSGATGVLLSQINGDAINDNLGISVAIAGDMNGDARAEFIVGARYADPGGVVNAGAAYVYYLCAGAKGDMNGVGGLTPADVVAMLNCVYLATGSCDLCFADVNCSADLSPADVVIELNMVYLAAGPGC